MKDKKILLLAAVLLIVLAGVAVYAVTENSSGNPEPAATAAAHVSIALAFIYLSPIV